ncbi:MAG: Hsp70 family protein [Bacteroidales bacterium]|nr:Hsp70 family protein [Bacteroidales bacterium]
MKTGIDLGTTYSLISHVGHDGRAILLPDHSNKDIFATPSVVHIEENTALVGHLVEMLMEEKPDMKVLRFFKRNFGIDKPFFYDSNNHGWYPEAISALLLKKLRFDAEHFSGGNIDGTVITVPAHFNDLQRKSVINAAALADLPLLGLVEEPVAAALHYGVSHKSHDQVLVVYDLGGGTFDVTVLSLDDKGVYVLAKDGHTELGGKEFDEKIGEFIIDRFMRVTGSEPELNAYTLLQLRKISEEIKIELSLPHVNYLKKSVLLDNRAIELIINRRDFEKSIHEAIEQTIAITMRCLDEAGLKEENIDALLLVGGSSMIPYIRERMRKIFTGGHQKIFYHEPMKAVAYGAGIHACQLSGDAEKYDLPPEFRGITGYNIGIRTINPVTRKVEVDVLIKKSMPLPARAKRTYYTTKAEQNRIVLDVVQMREKDNLIQVGKLMVGPLPNPSLNYAVEVTLENTEDGIITVSAYDPNTGVELEQSFNNNPEDMGYLVGQHKLVQETIINNLGI